MAGEDISGGTVVYQFIADTADLEAALARIQVEMLAAGDAAEGMGEGLDDAGDSIGSATKSASGGGRAMRDMATAVALISPQAAVAVRGLRGLRAAMIAGRTAAVAMGTSLVALAAPIALVAAALVTAGLFWRQYTKDIEEAEAAAAAAAATTSRMVDAAEGFNSVVDKVGREFAVFSGAISKADQQIGDFTASTNASFDALVRQVIATDNSTVANKSNRESVRDQLVALEAKREATIAQFTTLRRSEQAERDLAKATNARRAVDAKAAEASKKEAAERAVRNAAIVEGMHQIELQGARVINQTNAAFAELIPIMDELDAVMDETLANMAARQQNLTQGTMDSLSALGTLSGTIADKLAEDGKKGARAAFRISQAAAIGQIAISTAVAIAKVTAQAGIAAPFAIAGVAAIGAAQAGIVLAQSPPAEHIGTGLIGGRDPLAPDESISSRGRRVLNNEAQTPFGTANTTGSSMLNDLNTGRLGGAGGGTITAVIGRRSVDNELFQSGRSGTTRYARDLRKNPHPKNNRGW